MALQNRPTQNAAIGRQGVTNALRALKRREVLRWLTLLEFSDLMLDVMLGFLALYFVDVAGATFEQAALAVTVWTVVGLAGDHLGGGRAERRRGQRAGLG